MMCPQCSRPGWCSRSREDPIAGGVRHYYNCDNLHQWQTVETIVDQSRVDRAQLARIIRQQREQLDRMAAVLGVEG